MNNKNPFDKLLAKLLKNKNAQDKDELQKLKEIKKKIKKIKNSEELEEFIQKLEKEKIVDEGFLEELKEKKKRQYRRNRFRESLRVNQEIIDRINQICQNFVRNQREIENKEPIHERDERLPNGGTKNKDKDERTRGGSGVRDRSRGAR